MMVLGRIRDRRKVWSGALFLAIGLGALLAAPLPLGKLTDMGPGFFPVLLGAGLVMIGGLSIATGALSAEHVAIERVPWQPMLFLLTGVVLAALLLTGSGLVAALFCLVVTSCYARLRQRPLEILAIYAVLLPLIWGIFIVGVQLPITLF